LLACETLLPTIGALPVTWQTRAMMFVPLALSDLKSPAREHGRRQQPMSSWPVGPGLGKAEDYNAIGPAGSTVAAKDVTATR